MTEILFDDVHDERTETLYQEQLRKLRSGTDRIFAVLMGFQWIVGIATAVVISPRTWIGETSSVHLHVWGAVLLGGVLSGFPIFLAISHPGTKLTRHSIAVAQMLWSALLIHLSGGRIETHFHVFGSLAFIAFYRDWRVLMTATVVVAADHFLRGVYWPQSVFGVMVESPWRWIEHAGWAVFEDVILVVSCFRGTREAREISSRQALLERTNERIEQEVSERTLELRAANERLAGEIRDRESAEARETRLGRIIEHSLNEIYVFDRHSLKFCEVNRGALRNLGYSMKEMYDLTPLDLKPKHTMDSFVRLIEPLVCGAEEVIPFETEHRRKDGSLYPVEVHLQLAEWDSRDVFVAIILDISERQKLQSERDRIQTQLVEASRSAGMAEIATGILHNVGNVLNSVNVSANMISNRLTTSRVTQLPKIVGLLDEHAEDLGTFITIDEKGQRLPGYLSQLSDVLVADCDTMQSEFESIQNNIDHIKEIVQVQQAYAQRSGVEEVIAVTELVEMALKINDAALIRHEIEIVREYDDVGPIVADKHLALQILINLITNAKNAIDEHDGDERRLVIRVTRCPGDHVGIEVQDSGRGIKPENLIQIFTHGFTTRSEGHGFGLHSSANAAVEMGGSLSVSSDGEGQGATFFLKLPMKTVLSAAGFAEPDAEAVTA